MLIVKTTAALQQILDREKVQRHQLGFVPTMGALHSGHLQLVETARKSNDVLLCSIFVNPTQFNIQKDYEKYPITIENDIDLLESMGCDILFLPSVNEMYPADETVIQYDLGYLEDILEGKFRPGHFQGVCRIVDKFLEISKPHTLYLGQKDYQQCMVIRKMMQLRSHQNRLEICPTVREDNGLAKSSRNMRLNGEELNMASAIYKALSDIKTHFHPGNSMEVQKIATGFLEAKGFIVDYVTIADAETLHPVKDWDGKGKLVTLAAAYLNEVRLIDNLLIN